jgi:glutamate carboxypeptidase
MTGPSTILGLAAAIALVAPAAPVESRQEPQARLSDTERAMAAFVDANAAEAIALLERVVNINSGTQHFEGVREVGRIFAAEFEGLGFKSEWIDGASWQRAGHLVARHPGAGPKILLIGHLDTVFEPDSPFQRFERLDEHTARGPGVIDMKGGDVIIVQALKALQSVGLLDGMNLVVVMTGDEESAGRPLERARAALVEAAQNAEVAIGFEDGDGDPAHGVIARRGTSAWRLTVTGTAGHSSQIFTGSLGAGAVFEAARILDTFRERLAGEPYLTFNPGVMLGGTSLAFDPEQSRGEAFGKTNVIAEHTLVSGDLRALSTEQFTRAKQMMTEIVKASLPNTSAEILFEDGYPALAPTDGNRKLLGMFSQASLDLGLGEVTPVDPARAGAADVSFIAGHVPMIMDAAGLKGHDGHTVNETADLRVLAIQAKRTATLLARLAGG